MDAGRLLVGISGWTYPPWRGTFYPPGLAHRLELEHASARFTSIEVNGSFYSLQRPQSWRSWAARTPAGFVFSVKGGRFITHMKKLVGVESALANFYASGVLALGPKLGPTLWQLPPQLAYDRQRLEAFLRLLPRTTSEAAALARRHDERMRDRAVTETDAERPVRHALEVRHASYESPELVELLRAHDVALVVADSAGAWPMIEDRTAGFGYVRLHGADELYTSGYTDEALDAWAGRVRAWSLGQDPPGARLLTPPASPNGSRDVYVYFDNDAKVRAPFDAMALMRRLGISPP